MRRAEGERRKIVFPRKAGADYLLSPSLSGRLRVIWTEILPGGSSGDEPHTHDSAEECGVVLKGRLRVWVGDDECLLGKSDSITFASRIPHRWENAGRGKVTVLWAITPPWY